MLRKRWRWRNKIKLKKCNLVLATHSAIRYKVCIAQAITQAQKQQSVNNMQNKINKAQAQYVAAQAQTAQMRSVSYVAFKLAVAEEDAALAKLQKLQAQVQA